MSKKLSCILPTRDRAAFFAQAMRCFRRQTLQGAELVVIDDGDAPVEALCAGIPHLRYIRLDEPAPTGKKLNVGIENASGDVLQKLDDDDWYGPEFLSMAAGALDGKDPATTLVAWCCFHVLIAGSGSLRYSGHGWHAGGTLCFAREMWERRPFRETRTSSDSWFKRDHQPEIVQVCAPDQYIVVRHGANTWQGMKGYSSVESYFLGCPESRGSIETIVGSEQADFYSALLTATAAPPRDGSRYSP